MLLASYTTIRQYETHQALFEQRADEKTSPPRGKRIAGVVLRTGRRDDRIPVIDRIDESRARRDRIRDRISRILLAESDHRPAVVLPLFDDVQLVASSRPVVDDPELSLRVEDRRLHVAVAEGPDLWPRV